MRRVSPSRRFSTRRCSTRPSGLARLLCLLVVLGQQGGLLHHVGHALDEAARVAPDGKAGAPGTEPDAGKHAGPCALCIGYSGGAASPPPDALAVPAPAAHSGTATARSAVPRQALLVATPIRAPPAARSVHA